MPTELLRDFPHCLPPEEVVLERASEDLVCVTSTLKMLWVSHITEVNGHLKNR